jgi:ribosomal protein L29
MPELDENKDLLEAIDLGTGDNPGDADQEDEGKNGQEAQGSDKGHGTVPVGVLIEMRRHNQELKRELAALRGEVQAVRESGGTRRDDDQWADLRDMSDDELKEYADEGKEEASRVRKFLQAREAEREDRLVEKVVSRQRKAAEDDDLNRASSTLRALQQANPWLTEDGPLAAAANAAYMAQREAGKSPTDALRGMIREMAPLVVARGHKIQGLTQIDPEFVQSLSQGRTAAPARRSPVNIDDGLGGGGAERGLRATPPPVATASPKALLRAYAQMTPAEQEAWLESTE